MFLEAVTVCVNYSDFLKETIPFNMPLFDRWVIVTTPQDTDTRELCRRYGLRCIVTDEFFRDGDEFNKGRGIIRGIDMLAGKGWVLHLDADMVLPHSLRRSLNMANLDKEYIYGIDRVMVKSYSDWQKLKYSGYLQHDYHVRVNFPPGFDVGARWASELYGYIPLGCFQLWWSETDLYKGMHTKPYPTVHGEAARGDIQHGLQWDRSKRAIIPEVVGVHLESEKALLGANWKGRKTRLFGPEKA